MWTRPKQPIAFSHRVHVGDLGMDCRFCHNTVEQTAAAPLPSGESCMSCHAFVKKDTRGEAPRRGGGEERTHPLGARAPVPDYSRFHHGVHVQAGVSCLSCHGESDRMPQVRQLLEPLSMSWCLDCHRNPAPNLRPTALVTRLDATIPDPLATGERLMKEKRIQPSTDCSACHQ